MESAALVAPLTNRAPVTHHKTVVRTCQWCVETKFPAGINLVQTVAPDWRQIESLMALDLIIIPADPKSYELSSFKSRLPIHFILSFEIFLHL